MKKQPYKNLTTEQLIQKAKGLKIVTGMLAGILTALFVLTLYNSITNNTFDPLLVTAIALSAILPINYMQIKNMQKEIKSRE